MALLARTGLNFVKNSVLMTTARLLSVTQPVHLREIRENIQGDKLVVEAVNIPSPRTELLVRPENTSEPDADGSKTCYMCALGLDVKHTDVLILSQFVRSDGCMLPRRITGLCPRQQKKIGKMVSMAQKAGLMINLTPTACKKDPTKRKDWKKFNTYFDEKTIFMKKIPNQNDKYRRNGSIYFDKK